MAVLFIYLFFFGGGGGGISQGNKFMFYAA